MAISNPLTPTTVADFSGGISDNYFTAAPNCSYKLNNLWLDENSKPYTRPGITCFTNRLPTSATLGRISGIYIGSKPYGSPVFFIGPTAYYMNSSDTFTQIGTSSLISKGNDDLESSRVWQGQIISVSNPLTTIPNRIYCTDVTARTYKTVSLGLPKLASTPTLASAGGNGQAFVYAFHYYYTFTDYLGTIYIEQGPRVQATITNVGAPDSDTITISGIPTLSNTPYSNWDTANVVVKIFRTQNNGTALYHVTDVANGTATYADSHADVDIVATGVTIYTDGGVLDWDPPMALSDGTFLGAKYCVEVNDFFWYANDYILTQSVQAAPGACPNSFQQPIAQKIKGLGSIIGFPVLFCDQSIYRIDGTFDESGNGGFELREISQTAGLIGHRAIVSVPGGLVFPGNGGFYFTDGYQVQKISDGVNIRYQTWINPNMMGSYDPIKNMVHWIVTDVQNSSGTYPNSQIVTLHLNFGLNAKSVFTTSSSKTQFLPTSVAYTESSDADSRFLTRLLFGTADGYFMYLDPLGYVDPNINHDVVPSLWTKKTIIYRYESLGMNLGDEANRKYLVELTAEFQSDTDLAVQFLSRRDDGGPWGTLSEIRSDGALIWNVSPSIESNALWADPNDPQDHDWNSQPIIEGKRHFPSGTLRSSRRQVGLTNSYTQIARSDDQSVCSIDPVTRLAILQTVGTLWPDDCEDYFISFAPDGYAQQFQIQTRVSDTTIKIFDPYGQLPSKGAEKWQIAGYRKNEVARLLSYTVFSDLEGTTQAPNRGQTGLINNT